jgi:hypothetical protein
MSTTREAGKVHSTFYGREDHGILTAVVRIEFDGGGGQGFGCLAFANERIADDFVVDLCTTFGVKRLQDLHGRRCIALRCFGYNNELIEALEAPDGKRFVLTAWRRKHDPDAPTPLEARSQQVEREIALLERRLVEERARLRRLSAEYRPVPGEA